MWSILLQDTLQKIIYPARLGDTLITWFIIDRFENIVPFKKTSVA